MRTLLRRLAITIVVVLVLIQLYRPARTNPEVETGGSLESRLAIDPETLGLLRQACYDCHSNETEWPWYSNVAPVSWFVTGHVDHAREHMNLSRWSELAPDDAGHKLEEICEEVEEGEMPLASYRLLHPEGRLTDEQREAICRWTDAARRALRGGEAGPP